MAEQAKKQEIPAMYGNFTIYGRVEKINKENFESKTQTQKDKRSLTLTIRTAKDNVVILPLTAVAQENVYFSKRDEENKTSDTKIIPWSERNNFNVPGYLPMSRVNVGVEQNEKPDGTKENISSYKIMFDALQDIYDHVNVGDELFIMGSVSVENYIAQNGEVRNTVRLIPTQISKRTQSGTTDFDDPDFQERNELNQTIIPTSIEVDEEANRAVIFGLVIGNKREGTIEFVANRKEDMSFIKVLQGKIANNPYLSLRLNARIANSGRQEEQKVWDETWQTYIIQPRVGGSRTVYEYNGLVNGSFDEMTYNAENIEAFRNAFCRGQQEFGSNSTGNKGSEDALWGTI